MVTSTFTEQLPNQYEGMLINYASIVEKTNQQLSLWYNPYGIIIASLTALITVGAIVATILIYRSSTEYKKQIKNFISEQDKLSTNRMEKFDKSWKEREEKASRYETALNKLIDQYKDKLEKIGSENKDELQKIQETIDELNKSKASLGAYALPMAVFDTASDGARVDTIKCFGCGNFFQYKSYNLSLTNYSSASDRMFATVSDKKMVECPKCGHKNYV
jgi:DNA repair exonuclease SbcCD ATPase subunit